MKAEWIERICVGVILAILLGGFGALVTGAWRDLDGRVVACGRRGGVLVRSQNVGEFCIDSSAIKSAIAVDYE